MTPERVDALIVGAGLSGIAAAYYLQTRCPNKSWTIVEARDAIGGTWDLFRYPGVRSDSDMYTLGYRFRPWRGEQAIADGPAILQYIRDTAREYGIDRHIRFQQRVTRIDWSSTDAEWTVELQRAGDPAPLKMRCGFLFMCSGYYRYDQGYTPEWPGRGSFRGAIVHPQAWRGVDYADKRIIVIGSGATAVTMAPALAESARHVTLLQRSPSYIVSMPSRDKVSGRLHAHLPTPLAAWLARWRSILINQRAFQVARSKPRESREFILNGVRAALGPGYDVERHFAPSYNPWEQRLCLAPDADLFRAIKSGQITVVTDHIDRFTPEGILLRSGQLLPADIIVTATGLRMSIMHKLRITVDGQRIELSDTFSYKGVMYSGIPNLAASFGYTNASWTLKCELICEYVCRLLNYMERRGYDACLPRREDAAGDSQAFVDFSSGYVRRALDTLPKQGNSRPWKLYQNYLKDLLMMRYGRLNDGVMAFTRRPS